MAEMTKADWDLKDRRIVRQSMMKAAVEIVLGCNSITQDLSNLRKHATETAEQFVDWVYEVEAPQIPTPTAEQAKALDKVLKETGWTKEQVFKKFDKYPVLANVDKCIERIKNG